jgi:Flp pilus assembly protein TadG
MTKASLTRALSLRSMGDRGNAALEFALVAPIFIAVLIGIMFYGIYFGVAHSVAQIAADAARASIPGLSTAERSALAKAEATEIVANSILLRPAQLTVLAAPRDGNPNIFDVRVTYDSSHLPIYAFSGLLPTPDKVIVRSASIQRGGY